MKVAAVQFNPNYNSIEGGIQAHLDWITKAASLGVDLILFPEMSLSGYHRADARKMALTKNDPSLQPIIDLAKEKSINAIVGAPILLNNSLYIGSFLILDNGKNHLYTKQYLHESEEKFFSSSFDYNPIVTIKGKKITLAICADISHPEHIETAKQNGADLYLASLFFSTNGIPIAHQLLTKYATSYEIGILMANYCKETWNLTAGGKSAYWNIEGRKIDQLNETEEGILIVDLN